MGCGGGGQKDMVNYKGSLVLTGNKLFCVTLQHTHRVGNSEAQSTQIVEGGKGEFSRQSHVASKIKTKFGGLGIEKKTHDIRKKFKKEGKSETGPKEIFEASLNPNYSTMGYKGEGGGGVYEDKKNKNKVVEYKKFVKSFLQIPYAKKNWERN